MYFIGWLIGSFVKAYRRMREDFQTGFDRATEEEVYEFSPEFKVTIERFNKSMEEKMNKFRVRL